MSYPYDIQSVTTQDIDSITGDNESIPSLTNPNY